MPGEPASRGPTEQEPQSEAGLGDLSSTYRELKSAFEHLRSALAAPDLKGAVLKTLETFALQAGWGPLEPGPRPERRTPGPANR